MGQDEREIISAQGRSVRFDGDTTVEQLMEALKQLDPKAVVIGIAHNFELKNSEIPVSGVAETMRYRVRRRFRDAFDGGEYYKEIFSTHVAANENGIPTKCVNISTV